MGMAEEGQGTADEAERRRDQKRTSNVQCGTLNVERKGPLRRATEVLPSESGRYRAVRRTEDGPSRLSAVGPAGRLDARTGGAVR